MKTKGCILTSLHNWLEPCFGTEDDKDSPWHGEQAWRNITYRSDNPIFINYIINSSPNLHTVQNNTVVFNDISLKMSAYRS